jgi:hypothetical protein
MHRAMLNESGQEIQQLENEVLSTTRHINKKHSLYVHEKGTKEEGIAKSRGKKMDEYGEMSKQGRQE